MKKFLPSSTLHLLKNNFGGKIILTQQNSLIVNNNLSSASLTVRNAFINNVMMNRRGKTILSDTLRTQTKTSKGTDNNQSSGNEKEEKQGFSASDSSTGTQSKYKKYATWTLVGLAGLIGWMELNYRSSPEFSAGDAIRKAIYGNPYRNYLNTKNGVVLELSVDGNASIVDEDASQVKKLVYISEEGNIHLIVPDNFVQPGLLVNESSAFRDSGKFRLTDISGNDLILEWNRINTVLRTNLQSTMTPTEEILKACAYKYIESLLERTDGINIQRTEYIHIPNPRIPVKPLESLDPLPVDLPYSRIANKKGMDMVCVVSSHPVSPDSQEKLYRADLWYVHYPFVYHFCVNQPEQTRKLANFLQEIKVDPNSEKAREIVKQASTQLTNKDEVLEQITSKTFAPDRLTLDPAKIGLNLRNDLLRVQHNSFCKFISV
ncbi:predicted protein [Naegleria gruberi]|uniref:Predicted protein n=1 Tax=Naegleria gruberi TaxID=5762 RepID=D2V7I4_NAEGR|nr:uncharacterized protein NAEGRDRAFT_64815 [Naegleria gruberi]EFC47257.1 predicted protein [Naegleria gruberi]|eukprot:XP_002680001.1 predicted protein [Naegleria gruberi strain NEG-M]